MIQRVLGPGVYLPPTFDASATSLTAANTYRIDASGEVAGVIFQAPKAGTIVGCDVCIAAVANAPDNGLQIGRQGITASTGLPDGSFVASETTTGGSPSAAGWLQTTWDTPQVVTRGELLCLMVTFPSFVTGDSVVIGAGVKPVSIGLPYGILPSGSKSFEYLPIILPRYSDGSYGGFDEHVWPVEALTYQDVRTTTTPNEIGTRLLSPVPLRVQAVAFQCSIMEGTSDYDILITDAAGRHVAPTQSVDASIAQGVGHLWHTRLLPDDVVLQANTEYFVSYRPSTANANNLRAYYGTFPNAEAMKIAWGGLDWYMVARKDGGAWTRYNNAIDGYRRLRISLIVNGFDDGAVTPRTRALRRPA
jgi:hypothetical protein